MGKAYSVLLGDGMNACSCDTQGLLRIVWEADDYPPLSPCQLSSLLAQELIRKQQDAWGEWHIDLTEKGYNLMTEKKNET